MRWKFWRRKKIKEQRVKDILSWYMDDLTKCYPIVSYNATYFETFGKDKAHCQIKIDTVLDLPKDFIRSYVGVTHDNYGIVLDFSFNLFNDDETSIRRSCLQVFSQMKTQLRTLSTRYTFYSRPRTNIV